MFCNSIPWLNEEFAEHEGNPSFGSGLLWSNIELKSTCHRDVNKDASCEGLQQIELPSKLGTQLRESSAKLETFS